MMQAADGIAEGDVDQTSTSRTATRSARWRGAFEQMVDYLREQAEWPSGSPPAT